MTADIIKTFIIALVAVLSGLGAASLVPSYDGVPPVFGGVATGQEYTATSTAENSMYGARTIGDFTLKTSAGALGSIIITGANTGIVNFYNATTSNVNARTGQKATSTILIASLPASLAAGTYVFDVGFSDGLLMDIDTGVMPTSTITWR